MITFQGKVYKVVKKIPGGKTLSYKETAKLAGKPRAWRAVGNILNKNKDKKIPRHRVVRSNGKIGGYNSGIKEKIRSGLIFLIFWTKEGLSQVFGCRCLRLFFRQKAFKERYQDLIFGLSS